MAESEQSQERTEEATPRRSEQAREEGQIARSRELSTAVIMVAGCAGLLIMGGTLSEPLLAIFLQCFQLTTHDALDPQRMMAFLHAASVKALLASLPLLTALLLAGLIGPLLLGGWNLSSKALMPQMSRLNPLSGLGRMLSGQAMMELLKGVLKVSLFAGIAWLVLKKQQNALLTLDQLELHTAMARALDLLLWSCLLLCLGFIVIVAVDVPWQLWSHQKKMRMTKQEVRDEMRDQDGKPEVKSKVRQLQRDMARSRMMSAVPAADVIITNPTHFAVALKYDMAEMDAPRVVAKGADIIALRIRDIAREHRVEIVESPALARALYYSTEIERSIPPGLYVAVAQVLAYVYQLKQYRKGGGERPTRVRNVTVPREWRRDPDGKPEDDTPGL